MPGWLGNRLYRRRLDQGERDRIKKALLDYCGQDTLAMVRLGRETSVGVELIDPISHSTLSIPSRLRRRLPPFPNPINQPQHSGFWRHEVASPRFEHETASDIGNKLLKMISLDDATDTIDLGDEHVEVIVMIDACGLLLVEMASNLPSVQIGCF